RAIASREATAISSPSRLKAAAESAVSGHRDASSTSDQLPSVPATGTGGGSMLRRAGTSSPPIVWITGGGAGGGGDNGSRTTPCSVAAKTRTAGAEGRSGGGPDGRGGTDDGET